MTNGITARDSKFLVALGAVAAFAFLANATFAEPIVEINPRYGGDDIMPVPPVSGGGGNPLSGDPDGTWIADASGNWSDGTKWSGGIIADGGGFANFSTVNITAARTVTIDTVPRTVRRIDIGDTDASASYTIASSGVGANLIFDNTANSANAQLNEVVQSHGDTISAPIVLNSSLDVTNASAFALILSGGISAGTSGTKTVTTSTGTVTVSGVISNGSGVVALAQNGPGTLALGTLANTYSGGTTIAGGKITIGGTGTPLGSGTLTLAGGSLVTTASRLSMASLAPNVVVTADSAITTTSTAAQVNLPFSGTLTGTAGTLTIRNDAAATTGLFDVRFNGGDFTMSRPIVLDNGAGGGSVRLSDFNQGTTHTYSGVISGNGAFNRTAAGSGNGGLTVFTAANTYTGTTTVNDGTLQLGNGGTTGSLSSSSSIQIDATGTLRFNHTSGADFTQGINFSSSAIAGAGKIIKDGTCTLTLNVANTFSGGLTINAGTVIASADGALGTGNVSLTAGSITLTLQNGVSQAYIASTATLSYVSGDTINLNYTGTDTVTGLTVDGVAQGPGTYGASAINPDGVFTGTGTITVVVPEPTTVAMMAFGAGLLFGMRRLRREQRSS